MRVSRFEWDKANIEHIARHQVTPEEVEEVFAGQNIIKRTRDGMYQAFGNTDDGRYLFVVFVRKKGMIRVITGRDMTRAERKYFMRH